MSFLAEPVVGQRISPRSLAYISEATRDALYDFIIQRFVESGLTKAELARRLGKDAGQLTRTLGAPGNWTIDTCAELLFSIDGSMLTFGQSWPLRERPTNRSGATVVDCEQRLPGTSMPAVGMGQFGSTPQNSGTAVRRLVTADAV